VQKISQKQAQKISKLSKLYFWGPKRKPGHFQKMWEYAPGPTRLLLDLEEGPTRPTRKVTRWQWTLAYIEDRAHLFELGRDDRIGPVRQVTRVALCGARFTALEVKLSSYLKCSECVGRVAAGLGPRSAWTYIMGEQFEGP
jgi:hypothetical protein